MKIENIDGLISHRVVRHSFPGYYNDTCEERKN